MSTSLAAAILAALLTPGGHQVAQCRPHCAAHADELAHAIEGAADAHGVDAWLLAALAGQESGLVGNENATSGGMFGVHKRSRLWRAMRAACGGRRGRLGRSVVEMPSVRANHACLDVQADLAALELRKLLADCGTEAGALSAWRTGQCDGGETGERYARRVLRRRDALMLGDQE